MTATAPRRTAADYEPHVGTTFRVVGLWSPEGEDANDASSGPAAAADPAPAPVELVLDQVTRFDFPGPFEQFRLSFSGPAATPLDQETYVVEHDVIPCPSLFLVPSSERGDIRTYEASISIARTDPEGLEP